ncbi:MAG: hypothetical protein LBJ23_08880 [Tannerella sp.]|jgi:tetratricopeptide (TPR) repeat protein|nr:hypothetical protein [Tannerella sp.]
MKKIDKLLRRYAQMGDGGAKTYFDADEIAEMLDYFEKEDDLDRYETVLKFGTKLHPENPRLKLRACKLLMFQKKYEEALELIMQTGCDREGDMELLKLECFCMLDRYDEVLDVIARKQIEDAENVELVYEYVASVLGGLDDKENELEALIHEGLTLFPDNPVLREEYCYLLEQQGHAEKAIQLCEKLIDFDPYVADYWYMASRLYAGTDEYDKAIESLDFALVCDDSDLEIKIFRAYCLYKNDLFAKAVNEFREIFASEKEEVDELIQAIVSEYPVPDDFREVCFLFGILRNETDKDISSLFEHPAYQYDTGETPAVIARHFDSLVNYVKQYFSDEETQNDDIHYLHADDICPAENGSISSRQLATNYLMEKYHNN